MKAKKSITPFASACQTTVFQAQESRDSPDFKGIKTRENSIFVRIFLSRDSPDFKGMKTNRPGTYKTCRPEDFWLRSRAKQVTLLLTRESAR